MAEKIHLEIVTPKGSVLSDDVDIVTAPGYGGEFGVLANHAPFLSTIKIGTLSYKKGGQEEMMMVSGGFCEVSNNKSTFLVEAAERGGDIDVDRALRAKERAEKPERSRLDTLCNFCWHRREEVGRTRSRE